LPCLNQSNDVNISVGAAKSPLGVNRIGRVEVVLQGFFSAVERAAAYHREPHPNGQHVPFHGDFVSATPSVMGQLEWWVREMRTAIDEKAK